MLTLKSAIRHSSFDQLMHPFRNSMRHFVSRSTQSISMDKETALPYFFKFNSHTGSTSWPETYIDLYNIQFAIVSEQFREKYSCSLCDRSRVFITGALLKVFRLLGTSNNHPAIQRSRYNKCP